MLGLLLPALFLFRIKSDDGFSPSDLFRFFIDNLDPIYNMAINNMTYTHFKNITGFDDEEFKFYEIVNGIEMLTEDLKVLELINLTANEETEIYDSKHEIMLDTVDIRRFLNITKKNATEVADLITGLVEQHSFRRSGIEKIAKGLALDSSKVKTLIDAVMVMNATLIDANAPTLTIKSILDTFNILTDKIYSRTKVAHGILYDNSVSLKTLHEAIPMKDYSQFKSFVSQVSTIVTSNSFSLDNAYGFVKNGIEYTLGFAKSVAGGLLDVIDGLMNPLFKIFNSNTNGAIRDRVKMIMEGIEDMNETENLETVYEYLNNLYNDTLPLRTILGDILPESYVEMILNILSGIGNKNSTVYTFRDLFNMSPISKEIMKISNYNLIIQNAEIFSSINASTIMANWSDFISDNSGVEIGYNLIRALSKLVKLFGNRTLSLTEAGYEFDGKDSDPDASYEEMQSNISVYLYAGNVTFWNYSNSNYEQWYNMTRYSTFADAVYGIDGKNISEDLKMMQPIIEKIILYTKELTPHIPSSLSSIWNKIISKSEAINALMKKQFTMNELLDLFFDNGEQLWPILGGYLKSIHDNGGFNLVDLVANIPDTFLDVNATLTNFTKLSLISFPNIVDCIVIKNRNANTLNIFDVIPFDKIIKSSEALLPSTNTNTTTFGNISEHIVDLTFIFEACSFVNDVFFTDKYNVGYLLEELTGRSSTKFVSASKALSASIETDNVTLEHIQSFITETDFLVHASSTNPDPNNDGTKASSNGVLIGTLIGLVVIIAVAVYYFVFMKKDDSSSPDSVEEAKP